MAAHLVQKKLELTEDQRTKLRKYNNEWNEQMNVYSKDYQKDSQGVSRRFETMRKQYNDRLNSILNEQQQQAWSQMTGDPYEFQPSVYFPGTAAPPSNQKNQNR